MDYGIANKNINLIWSLVISQLFIFIGNYSSNAFSEFILNKIGLSISIKMLVNYLSKLSTLPISFFAKKVNSDLIQKVEDYNRIKNYLLSIPDTFILNTISLLTFSILLIYFSTPIFLIFVSASLINLIWTFSFLRLRREIDSSLNTRIAENRNNLFEFIEGIEEIKAYNAYSTRLAIWNKIQQKINSLSNKAIKLRLIQNGGNNIISRLRDIVITGICAVFVTKDYISIGTMMTISYIIGRLSAPFSSIFFSVNASQDALLSFNRIQEISDWVGNKLTYENKCPLCNFIDLRNVSFKYPGSGSPLVLNNINLQISKGQIVAFVGESGCGKSTLLKLILGFFSPTSGHINSGVLNDNFDFADYINHNISIVLQNGSIFSGSILSNIGLADEVPDIDKAMFAAKLACLDNFINSLPLGINTKIGKTGLSLSGGQIQRVLIARALYKKPDILILDEATSSLDAITEHKIMNNIFNEFSDKTIIIAAHRLSTIRHADKIFVLKNGNLVEEGSHEELLSLSGHYKDLIKNQNQGLMKAL